MFWEAVIVWSEDRDADRRQLFTLIRNVGHSLFNLQLQMKDKIKPEKYLRLPWDAPAERDLSELDESERNKSLEALRAAMKTINW